jgi:hypothetical protein
MSVDLSVLEPCLTSTRLTDVKIFEDLAPTLPDSVFLAANRRSRSVDGPRNNVFLPSNLEHDTAIRVLSLCTQVGDSVSEVRPVQRLDGEGAIELVD